MSTLDRDTLRQRLRSNLKQRQKLRETVNSSLQELIPQNHPIEDRRESQRFQPIVARQPHSNSLTEWLIDKLPEEWRSHLDDLRDGWRTEQRSSLYIFLRTQLCLLQMGIAAIQIYGIGSTTNRRLPDQR